MLLAAGLGTRLRPLTDERPKPVVPVGLTPLAASSFRSFERAHVSRIDANAHHLADAIDHELRPFAPRDATFTVHHEPMLLGTGGGIRNAVLEGIREDVFVLNGDIVFEPDVDALIRRHRESGAAATLVVRSHPNPFAIGAVEVDEDGYVLRIAGGPSSDAPAANAYMFTGAHILGPEALDALPDEGCVVRRTYQPLLSRGARIATVVDESPWADLGTIAAYFEANQRIADASSDPRGSIHELAEVRGSVSRCVVGASAVVGPHANLRNCVVWDGAAIDEPLEHAIVTPRTIVRVDR